VHNSCSFLAARGLKQQADLFVLETSQVRRVRSRITELVLENPTPEISRSQTSVKQRDTNALRSAWHLM